MHLSARGFTRLLRVARTVADLAAAEDVERPTLPKPWPIASAGRVENSTPAFSPLRTLRGWINKAPPKRMGA